MEDRVIEDGVIEDRVTEDTVTEDSLAESSQTRSLRLSVIVPARNEEEGIEACLRSLLCQSRKGFRLGGEWELLLVDDGSSDRTRPIAQGLNGVAVLDAQPLEPGWTGKANALWTAARVARGEWLLFTDADTVHQAGSLERAIGEAERANASLLSYSPRQLTGGFWQRALMPLVFSELASAYPPQKVSDPCSIVAAANGQFLMVRREAYFEVGGHAAVAGSLLEDVDLACLLKRRSLAIRFRYAPDALSTRMYRNFGQMFEGWSKNLARLFARPLVTAFWRGLDLALLLGLPTLLWACWRLLFARYAIAALWMAVLCRFYLRVAKSNFSAVSCALAIFGLPLFCLLLLRSWYLHAVRGRVRWKGREYSTLKK